MNDERLPYPPPWLLAATFETVSRQLTFAALTASPRVAEVLRCMEVAQPPRPDDPRATIGATRSQLLAVADGYGLDEDETDELISVCSRVGISERHALVLMAAAKARLEEVKTLEETLLLDEPAGEHRLGEKED